MTTVTPQQPTGLSTETAHIDWASTARAHGIASNTQPFERCRKGTKQGVLPNFYIGARHYRPSPSRPRCVPLSNLLPHRKAYYA
jgi:hypothetical protein